jgi:hypothetical protein
LNLLGLKSWVGECWPEGNLMIYNYWEVQYPMPANRTNAMRNMFTDVGEQSANLSRRSNVVRVDEPDGSVTLAYYVTI